MIVPFLDLSVGHAELDGELTAAFERVVERGNYILGPEVHAFEREFASYCGVKHCIGVGNGFDALQLLIRGLGIGAGDEVIVPAYTAVATWMAVTTTGATPVGVDIDARTRTIDPELAEQSVTSRTRAIVAVHLFGMPCEMDALADIAARHGLELLEDAAQAHGARYRGHRTGSLGRGAAFSFYPTKNLGAIGDGGAVTTDDDDLAQGVRMLRAYGWRERSNSEIKGVNSRLDELQAALLRVKLARLDTWNERRRAAAARYTEGLADVVDVEAPEVPEWAVPVWHLFVVATHAPEELRAQLAERGIGTLVHYDPLPHLTPAYRADGWKGGAFPAAERLASHAVSLPMYPQLSDHDIDEVVAALRAS